MINGELPRAEVVKVLESRGVSVSNFDGKKTLTRLENDDGVVLVIALPQWVVRRLVHQISRKFDIHIHLFYHSDMVD